MVALKKFPIYEAGKIEFLEQSGVQDKAWLEHPELGDVLFKASSIEPNCRSSFKAPLAPIPGAPGMLSTESPINPSKSIIFEG